MDTRQMESAPQIRMRMTQVAMSATEPHGRAHPSCGLAVGRDVPIAPPRHRRGARLGIVRPRCCAPPAPTPRGMVPRLCRGWGG